MNDNTRCYGFVYIRLPLIVLLVQVVIFRERNYKILGDFCLHRGTMFLTDVIIAAHCEAPVE